MEGESKLCTGAIKDGKAGIMGEFTRSGWDSRWSASSPVGEVVQPTDPILPYLTDSKMIF
jgi:hypothetical protein